MVQADRDVRRLFGRIAWPASVEGLLLVLLSSVDLIMVSGLGAEAAAAVGVFSQPKLVLLCAPRAFSVAVTVRCAHLHGQKQQDILAQSLKQVLVVSGAGCLIMLLAAWYALEPLLRAAGAQPDYLLQAVQYGKPMLVSLYFTALSTVLQGGLLGIGRTRIILVSNVLGNAMNIVVNALLIYGLGPFPRMGVTGAGLGTAVGAGLTLGMTVASLCRGEAWLCGRTGWMPVRVQMQPLTGMFLSALAEQSTERVGMFLYSRMAAGLGTIPFAVHTICMNLCDVYYCFAQGIGKASLSLAGYWTGLGDQDNLHRLRQLCYKWSTVLGLLAMGAYILSRHGLLYFYQLEPDAYTLASHILLMVGVVSIPETWSLLCAGMLRGLGQIRYVAVYSLVSIALIRPVLTWLLCYGLQWGLYGAWISLMLDQTMRASCAYSRLRRLLPKPQNKTSNS